LTFDWHNWGGDSFFCFSALLANNAEALILSVNYPAVPVKVNSKSAEK
jgi:hypothetical protein